VLELRGFGPPELIGAAYAAAVTLLDGSDALILDLRRNGGGSPDSVALWMSHFFPQGDQRHLNDIYTRSTDKTQQYWTLPSVAPRYAKPVYVLTSARTFSGGEECAYDFQTQKRALLVGQTTGGGANAGDRFSLGHGLVVNIPTARAINPITHTNWEHVGVKPDIETPAAQAQQVAYVAILRTLSDQAADPDEARRLHKLIALAEKGESEPPVFEMKP
jgi:C-terminal processing protease CtpA/Prc